MSIARFSRAVRTARAIDDDRGVALPTVMIFMLAGVILSLVVSSSVLYAYTFSSSTRAGVQSQAAAEAGISSARATLLNGECAATAGLVTSSAGQPEFSVQIYRPAAGGWTPGCPAMSEEARIVSTGTAESRGSGKDSSGDVSKVETILGSLHSDASLAATGPAVFAYASSGAGGGGRLVSVDGSNVDVMLHTGNVTCDGGFSGAANVVVKSGNFSAVGGCNLAGNVWVNGSITISGGAQIGGSLSGTNINISNGTVGGNAWADEVLTSTGGSIGGWASGKSIVMGGGSLGNTWTRLGGISMTGGTVRGSLTVNGGSVAVGGAPANGTVTATNGNLQGAVTATGDVLTRISVPAGVRSGGNVTIENGTTTGITATGSLVLTGGTANGAITTGGLRLGPNWATIGAANVGGPACFTNSGAVNGAVRVKSITVGGANSCAAQNSNSWWNGKTITVNSGLSAPGAPTLSASPNKPSAVDVPEWVDFGSKPSHFTATSWTGYTTYVTGSTCTPNDIWHALNAFGTGPGIIDARACTAGISLSGSGSEYTGPFAWGDDLTRNGFTFKNDVVIIANKFNLSGSGRFEGTGTESQLWLINPDTVGNSVPDCSAGQQLSITGGFSFPKLRTMIYSPCHITIGSSTQLKGQIFAGQTSIAGGATITYAPLGLPGYDLSTGEETAVVVTEWDRQIVSQRNISG